MHGPHVTPSSNVHSTRAYPAATCINKTPALAREYPTRPHIYIYSVFVKYVIEWTEPPIWYKYKKGKKQNIEVVTAIEQNF